MVLLEALRSYLWIKLSSLIVKLASLMVMILTLLVLIKMEKCILGEITNSVNLVMQTPETESFQLKSSLLRNDKFEKLQREDTSL